MTNTLFPPCGKHVLLDGKTERKLALNDRAFLMALVVGAVRTCGATVLSTQSHVFEPLGVSIVVLLAESHASLHTYPAEGVFMLDIFTCGTSLDPLMAAMEVSRGLGGVGEWQVISRGYDNNGKPYRGAEAGRT
jgi:S-adenosylmethionine decarboxylase proenzyme